jgi:hypothetical protein
MSRKRKIQEENRSFHVKWESDYLFAMVNEKITCLVCQAVIASPKEGNLRRHYEAMHKAKYGSIEGKARECKVNDLKSMLAKQQQVFKRHKEATEATVEASYALAHLIAKRSKPFTEGEFIKECILTAVEIICPEKLQHFKNISLSPNTIADRVCDIGDDIGSQLKEKISKFKRCSIAIDETTDVTDVAQLAIFVRGVDDGMQVTEELLDVVPMEGKTGSADIFEKLTDALKRYEVPLGKLCAFSSDGAPSMIGSRTGVGTRMQQLIDQEDPQAAPISRIHCILHQENLCAQVLNMENVMSVVVKIVNFIRARGLNHREFSALLRQLGADHQDLLYYSQVRWLSRGATLARFYELLKEIKIFLNGKGQHYDQLDDPSWVSDLAFLSDICTHLNVLNVSLQGKNLTASAMYDNVKRFVMKLKLFIAQLSKGELTHFANLQKIGDIEERLVRSYVTKLEALENEFERRFCEFRHLDPKFAVFSAPFTLDVEKVDGKFQLELIDLQCDVNLKTMFDKVEIQEFYRLANPERYPTLRDNATEVLSMFGSTYICEQYFSQMNHIKNKLRSRMVTRHLQAVSRITTTSFSTNFLAVAKSNKRFMVSTNANK